MNTANEDKLVELAKARFGGLEEQEEYFLRNTSRGTHFSYVLVPYNANKPIDGDKWGPERTLPADCLAWLCTDREAASFVTRKGIDIAGWKISGTLDLSSSHIPFPIRLHHCYFDQGIDTTYSRLHFLSLSGSHIQSFCGDAMTVDNGLMLSDGFRANGEVRLIGATIGRALFCDGGEFINPNGIAVGADGIRVGGDIQTRNAKVKGDLQFVGAIIGGDFSGNGSRYSGSEIFSINLERASIAGSVFLRNGLCCTNRWVDPVPPIAPGAA